MANAWSASREFSGFGTAGTPSQIDFAAQSALGERNYQALAQLLRTTPSALQTTPGGEPYPGALADAITSGADQSTQPDPATDPTIPPGQLGAFVALSPDDTGTATWEGVQSEGGLPPKRRGPVKARAEVTATAQPPDPMAGVWDGESFGPPAPNQLWRYSSGAAIRALGDAWQRLQRDASNGAIASQVRLYGDLADLSLAPGSAAVDQVQQQYLPDTQDRVADEVADETNRAHPFFLDPTHVSTPAEQRSLQRDTAAAVLTWPAAPEAEAAEALEEGIYEFPDQLAGGLPYVGQTTRLSARLAEHEREGRYLPGTHTFTPIAGGRLSREIAEHSRIQALTGGQKASRSPLVSNLRDPIGPRRRPGLGIPHPSD